MWVPPGANRSCGDGRAREPALSEVEGSKPSAARQLPVNTATLDWIHELESTISGNETMDHPDSVDTSNTAPFSPKRKDPVCGMDVDPANARHQTQHKGKDYFFCCAGCLAKFQANPEKILSSAPQPMGSGLVSLGGPALVMPLVMPTMAKPAAAPNATSAGASAKDTRAHVSPTYLCPMCPEVRQIGPGPCPK